MPEAVDSEDYPSRQDLVRAGLLALSTGLLGFVTSYALFVGPLKPAKALESLDRSAAERPQPAAYREHRSGSYLHFGFVAAASESHDSEARGRSRLQIEKPERTAAPVAVPRASASPRASATALPLPEEPEIRPVSRLQIQPPRTVQPDPAEAPITRAQEVAWPEAWQRFALSWVSSGDLFRTGGEGVMIGPGLVLTTLSAYQQSGGHVLVGGQACGARLEACDPSVDLALLQLPVGFDAPAAALSPDDPSSGQMLVCAQGSAASYQEVRSRGQAGGGVCAFYGSTAGPLGGGALINQRGEVVALSLPRARWGSLAWNLAIPASRLRQFLDTRPRPAGQPPRPLLELWSQALGGRVAPLGSRSAPNRSNGRVIPGQSLGNYPLGITLTQLRQELGAPEVLEQQGAFQRIRFSSPRLTFTLVQEVTVAIETDYGFYTLESGWSPGSRLDPQEARSKLPDSILCSRPGGQALCAPGVEVLFHEGSLSWIRVVVP